MVEFPIVGLIVKHDCFQKFRKNKLVRQHCPEYIPYMSAISGARPMFARALILPKKRSFFLFGPRNTGKSTLLKAQFEQHQTIYIDLLDIEEESRFAKDPKELERIVLALPEDVIYVIIDEIQKVPKLLDIVHRLMSKKNKYFIMSGSSARKLKKGGANLLAGRAFVYHLFPLSFLELGNSFDLDNALNWGTLPEIFLCNNDEDRQQFLRAYAHTYLKEEVISEQFIRNLDPFRRFLEVAAQNNAKIINYANIARDVGADEKTVKSYYSILEDTLIGFVLEPYHSSFRKRLSDKPKFYFFDPGVIRSLSRMTTQALLPATSYYGEIFETYIILEILRLSSYYKNDYKFSYLRTRDEVEIDLIIERPGNKLLCIEIKSSKLVTREQLSSFIKITKDIPKSEAICLSQDKYPKQIDNVTVFPWQQGIKRLFELE